jgi:DNA modification methylase
MKVEEVELSRLIPYSFNNKKHPETQVDHIANSIKMVGWAQPIVCDEDFIVLVGHGRLAAAKKLGLEKAPVYQIKGLTEAQKKAYRILDNKLAADAEWDIDNIKIEIEALEDLGFDVDEWALRDLLPEEEEAEPEVVDDDFEPDLEKECFIKRGDLITLGRHRVVCGDCQDISNWREADVCFTSPPYNRGDNVKMANKSLQTSSYLGFTDDLDVGEYRAFIGKVAHNALQKTNCAAINIQMLAGNKVDLVGWLYDFGNHLIDVLIWNKRLSAPAAAKNVINSNFEFVFLLSPEELPSRAIPTAAFHGDKDAVINVDPTRSLEFASIHGATMPLTFAAEVLKITGGETVIDPFLGTGTTLIACDQLNRTCVGIELEPQYCQVIIDRYKRHCEASGKDFECTINGEPYVPLDE